MSRRKEEVVTPALVACFHLPLFGIACERARQPDLAGRPLALEGADGRLAVVSAEAQSFGIRAGQTPAAARALCPDLVVLPYDQPAYEEAAHALWDLFAVESSVVEPVSPERCFVEMTGPDAPVRVRALSAAVAPRVGVSVRVGLATSKLVARLAAETGKSMDKPPPADSGPSERVLAVPVGREAAFLSPLSLEHVPGLDPKLRQQLERLGVRRFGDVLALPPVRLQKSFRSVGLLLQRLAEGRDGERVRPLWPPRRLVRERVFEEEVCDEATVREALRRLTGEIAVELAHGREFCRSLTLTLGQTDGRFLSEGERLSLPLDHAGDLFRAALRLLRRLPVEQPLLEVVLIAGDLGGGSGVQLALLDANDHAHGLPHERQARLSATLAYLRRRFGPGAVLSARMLRQARRVGLWTYPLGHLLNTPVQVATDRAGDPLSYRGRRHRRTLAGQVRRIHTRWRETEWRWGRTEERQVWRVETDANGLCELHRLDVAWTLGAVAD